MSLLITGLLIWTLVHFIPSAGIAIKNNLTEQLSDKGYKALFAVLILLSLTTMVLGWRNTSPTFLYALPVPVKPVSLLVLLVAIFLLGAVRYPSRIKRVIRHPQLTAIVLWSFAHLLVNGDSRSAVLFGWLGIWAVLEQVFINTREGPWVKPPAPSWMQE